MKTEMNKRWIKLENILNDEYNKKTQCKCGWKGREEDLDMDDESFEFYCPKCHSEIEHKGICPDVALFILKLYRELGIERKPKGEKIC
jgi:Zn finger protein HypA/HybF involved in hydrogenase expression